MKKSTLKGLEPYYAAIRGAAAQIGSHSEKQTFLKVIYENFYKVYNAKAADRLGVVYTPNEIVRFMVEGADWLCEKHFRRNLIEKDVEILDPATGTGTFICELLEHFAGQPAKLARKYKEELHANEVAILPYYVANLNIEATYAALTSEYAEFPNLCFVDTLDNVGLHTRARGVTDSLFGSVSEENVARIKRQNTRKISVVIGNPPYYANQANENDNNKNREYPEVDARIRQTYVTESTAQKTKRYDMYSRFFRWSSDRLSADGIIAFVTNRNFIDAREADGFRKTVLREFNEVYVLDLGGDVRANSKLSGTKHNVFGIQTGVAISFLIRRKGAKGARVFYARRPEYESAEEKLAFLASSRASEMKFEPLKPDTHGNWLAVTRSDFDGLMPIATKETKAATSASAERAIFKLFSLGVSTNRDEWLYADNEDLLSRQMSFFVDQYDRQASGKDYDTTIKWSRNLKRRFEQGRREPFDSKRIVRAEYRPFQSKFFYASELFVDESGSTGSVFPLHANEIIQNEVIMVCGHPQIPFTVHAVGRTPDAGYASRATQIFPRFQYGSGNVRVDNVTDWSLASFQAHYRLDHDRAARPITKEGIFHYVYAVLHDPVYRGKYSQNLKRDFPRIPLYGNRASTFWEWSDWGRSLIALHSAYDGVAPFGLARSDLIDAKARSVGQSPQCILKADKAGGRIVVDSETTLSGVPAEAWSYVLGNRSGIEWVLEQNKERRAKDPTLRERFSIRRFADRKETVVDLLQRVTTVSVQTAQILEMMRRATR